MSSNPPSRTTQSIKNSVVALVFYLCRILLSFYSRKIFLEYLGTEILGLNTTAMNLLEFLNLAELGLGPAISFTLYKPIRNSDHNTINEIISLQRHLFWRIGLIIIGGALILMLFFPWIFKKMELPLWYAYASFSVLLLSAVMSYFFNYKQIILSASQQNYKITYSFGSVGLIKTIVQIAAVYYLPNPYVWWLIVEAVFSIIATIVLNYTIKRNFPFLRLASKSFRELKEQYRIIITKTKQLVFHKLGGYILNQTSPLIIYAFLSLTTVALYGNYLAIINGITALFNSVFSGMSASVGDLVSEGNKEKMLSVFNELFSIRFYIITLLCFCIIVYSSSFIDVWIGSQYRLPMIILWLMTANAYIILSRTTVDAYLYALGQFQDIYSPIIEGILNLGLSILFGYLWGLKGILFGVFVSLFVMVFLWKPIFLFHWGFKITLCHYIKLYLKHILAVIISISIWMLINRHIQWHIETWVSLIYNLIIGALTFGCVLFLTMFAFRCEFTKSIKRIFNK